MTGPAPDALDRLILGESTSIQRLRALIRRVARSTLPVLIKGPTGAGKELVAEALHLTSGRAGEFVAFNVCAISDTMLEDALFGHSRGAFTGAMAERRGYLAEADRGTLFLDEVGGLPFTAQAKLLRAIENKAFRPVGASADRRSDFRVVAASNEDLEALAEAGRFRRDLVYRLGGVVLAVPALRERREDIPLLAQHFADDADAPLDQPARLTAGALRRLQRHAWPGNVRELRHIVLRAAALAPTPVLGAAEIETALTGEIDHDARTWSLERRRLMLALERHGWDTVRAALELGVTRKTVYARLRRYAIEIPGRYQRRRMYGGDEPTRSSMSAGGPRFTGIIGESDVRDGESP